MAGMLPGVEAARRRRFPHSNNPNHGLTSSLCLYERNHEFRISSSSSRSFISGEAEWDQDLDTVAKEAKRRLDKRLRSHLKSDEIKRGDSKFDHVKQKGRSCGWNNKKERSWLSA